MGTLAVEVTELDEEFARLKHIARNMSVYELAEYIKGQIEGGPQYSTLVDVALQTERVLKLTAFMCDRITGEGHNENRH